MFLASRKNNTVQLDFGFASKVRMFYAKEVWRFLVPVPFPFGSRLYILQKKF